MNILDKINDVWYNRLCEQKWDELSKYKMSISGPDIEWISLLGIIKFGFLSLLPNIVNVKNLKLCCLTDTVLVLGASTRKLLFVITEQLTQR